ncbi:MAG: energy-coupling factor ABC transporter permease [Rhodospirillaceae bacterium]
MHLSDGIIPLTVALPAAACAATLVWAGLRRFNADQIPGAAMLAAILFLAAQIHVPVGPSSTHLLLTGLAGLMLGIRIFPVLLVVLLLQAVLFGFGGVVILGTNLLILGLPAALCAPLFAALSRRIQHRTLLAAGAAVLCGGALVGSALLAAGALLLAGPAFLGGAFLVLATNAPVALVEGLVVFALVGFLLRVRPESLYRHAV